MDRSGDEGISQAVTHIPGDLPSNEGRRLLSAGAGALSREHSRQDLHDLHDALGLQERAQLGQQQHQACWWRFRGSTAPLPVLMTACSQVLLCSQILATQRMAVSVWPCCWGKVGCIVFSRAA